ncbi:hypothetical protein NDU88_007997 [Pleurodeles waltl]|uniref:Uncharacterized protein n=1 Tax=Pleurodeles waltl TaxID=8319 RepID=A0AAV7N5W8_PLEWA|nr:hypothetical protein NDU88_007997 [Pleurodeles waltl]
MQISAAERSEVERHFERVGASHLTRVVFAPRRPAEGRLLCEARSLLLPPADVGAGLQRCHVDPAVFHLGGPADWMGATPNVGTPRW